MVDMTNGRCLFHDPLRGGHNNKATTPVMVVQQQQSNWPQALRRKYAERGAMMARDTLDRLGDELSAKYFLYESTGDLEPLLSCISAQTHLDALLLLLLEEDSRCAGGHE